MTPEERARDVFRWLELAGALNPEMAATDTEVYCLQVAAAIREAVEEEREACAKLADDYALHSVELAKEFREFAAFIRARSQEGK